MIKLGKMHMFLRVVMVSVQRSVYNRRCIVIQSVWLSCVDSTLNKSQSELSKPQLLQALVGVIDVFCNNKHGVQVGVLQSICSIMQLSDY